MITHVSCPRVPFFYYGITGTSSKIVTRVPQQKIYGWSCLTTAILVTCLGLTVRSLARMYLSSSGLPIRAGLQTRRKRFWCGTEGLPVSAPPSHRLKYVTSGQEVHWNIRFNFTSYFLNFKIGYGNWDCKYCRYNYCKF